MAASTSDKFQKLGGSSSLVNTPRVTATRSAAGTSLTVDNCNWDTDTGKTFATYRVDTSGNVVANTQIIWRGVVTSTTSIGSLTRVAGASDTGNAIGDYVELLPASAWANSLIDGLLVEHKQTGAHGTVTADSVTAGSLISTGDVQQRSVSIETLRSHYVFDHVQSGLVWSGDSYGSTRAASMTAGYVYINGRRSAQIAAVSARTFTASKDTYVDVDVTGTITYTEVTNNAASPALAANNVRIAIIVTGASNIANVGSVNQGEEDKVLPIASSTPYAVTDSLGNLICPRDPTRKTLGYRRVTSLITNTNASATQIAGLSCPVIIPTGRKITAKIFCARVYSTGSTGEIKLVAWEGTVGSGTQRALGQQTGSASFPNTVNADSEFTPTGGATTFNASSQTSAGTANMDAAASYPMYIKIELA